MYRPFLIRISMFPSMCMLLSRRLEMLLCSEGSKTSLVLLTLQNVAKCRFLIGMMQFVDVQSVFSDYVNKGQLSSGGWKYRHEFRDNVGTYR